jgi:hypothetical protein
MNSPPPTEKLFAQFVYSKKDLQDDGHLKEEGFDEI